MSQGDTKNAPGRQQDTSIKTPATLFWGYGTQSVNRQHVSVTRIWCPNSPQQKSQSVLGRSNRTHVASTMRFLKRFLPQPKICKNAFCLDHKFAKTLFASTKNSQKRFLPRPQIRENAFCLDQKFTEKLFASTKNSRKRFLPQPNILQKHVLACPQML